MNEIESFHEIQNAKCKFKKSHTFWVIFVTFQMEQYHVCIPTDIFKEENKNPNSDDIVNNIEKSINFLRASILNLQETKNKYLINLHQFEDDYKTLHKIYHRIENAICLKDRNENEKNNETSKTIIEDNYVEQLNKPKNFNDINRNAIFLKTTFNIDDKYMKVIKNLKWDLAEGQNSKFRNYINLIYAFSVPAVLCSVQYDPSGKVITFSDSRNLHFISAKNGKHKFSMEIPRSIDKNQLHTRVIRFSPDGKYIAVSAKVSGIAVFSYKDKKFIGSLSNGTQGKISSLLFLKDSTTLISGSYNGNLCIWNIKEMCLVKMIPHQPPNDGKLNKDAAIVSITSNTKETYIAVGFMNGYIGVYDSSFTHAMSRFKAHNENLMHIETVKNDEIMVSVSQDKTAKTWYMSGVATNKNTFKGHTDYIICSAVSSDNNLLLTGSKDETIKGWDILSGENLFTLIAHQNTIFEIHHHPSRNQFVSCSGDGLICVWDYNLPKQ